MASAKHIYQPSSVYGCNFPPSSISMSVEKTMPYGKTASCWRQSSSVTWDASSFGKLGPQNIEDHVGLYELWVTGVVIVGISKQLMLFKF